MKFRILVSTIIFTLLFSCKSNNDKLIEACKEKDLLKVKELLSLDSIDVNYHNDKNETALFIAYQNNDTSLISLLLKNKASDKRVFFNFYTEILKAVDENNINIIHKYVKFGINFNFQQNNKHPLIEAISNAKDSIAKLIIDSGISLNRDTINKEFPLLVAVEKERINIINFLLNKQPDLINWTNRDGENLLFSTNNLQIVKILVEHGIDINKKNNDEAYPLFWKQFEQNSGSVRGKENDELKEIERYLIEKGAKDFNKLITPLLNACQNGNLDSVKLLHKKGIDLNAKFIWYVEVNECPGGLLFTTPIVKAVNSKKLELVKYLVESGVQFNFSESGEQPLYNAVISQDYKIADYLISRGAISDTIFALDYYDHYNYAVEKQDTVMLQYILKNGFKYHYVYDGVPPLAKAAKNGNLKFVKLIVEKVIVDLDNNEYSKALCYATNIEIAKYLIKKGGSLDFIFQYEGEGGCREFITPLNNAVSTKDILFVEFLLKNGANINFLDSYNQQMETSCFVQNPLCIAVQNNDIEMVKFLVKKGVTINFYIKYIWGEFNNPLFGAIKNNNIEMVKFLIEHKSKLKFDTISAINVAMETKNQGLINYIKSRK